MSNRQTNRPRVTCIARAGYQELEAAFLDDIARRRADDPWTPLLVVVPSRNVRDRLREALARRLPGVFGLHVVLFPELARRLLDDGGEQIPIVDDLSALLVLSDIVRRRQEVGGSPFRTVAPRPGFHEALLESFTELDESGLDDGAAPGRGASPRLAEVLALHREWRRALEARGLLTTAGLIGRAAGAPRTASSGPPLLVYGFYDFTGNQRRLVEAVAPHREVVVFLPHFPAAAGTYPAPAFAWLEALAGTIDRSGGGAEAARPSGPARYSAPGERREVEEAARRVLRLIDDGVAPGDIAVSFRNPEPYARLVTEVFTTAGIAMAGGAAARLSETRVGRTLRHVVAAARGERDRRELLDLFDLILADARAHRVAEWDFWTREAGITRGAAGWREGMNRLARHPGSPRESLAELQAEFDRLAPLLDALKSPRRFADTANALIAAGEGWFPDDPDWPEAEGTLRRLAALDRSGVPPTAATFDWMLGRLLDAPRRPVRDRRDGVRVLDVVAARGLSFRHLFLLGVTERVFPRVVTQDPILLDADRRRLAPHATWLPLRRAGVEEERLFFWIATSSAPNVTLSWSRLDPANGRPRIPSSFLLEAAAGADGAMPDIESLERTSARVPLDPMADIREAARRDPGPVLPGFGVSAILDEGALARLLLAAALGAGRDDRVAALCAGEEFARRRRAELARATATLSAFDGALTHPAVLDRLAERYGAGHAWSASQLESYAHCPQRFFLERLLGLESVEAPEDVVRVSPLDRGRVLHDILRTFLVDPETGPLVRERRAELRARLRAVAGRQLAEFAATAHVGGRLVWRLDAARFVDDLLDWLDFELQRDDPRRPARFEVRFGLRETPGRVEDPGSTTEGPVLTLADGDAMRFGGYVDRIDLDDAAHSARILDYKSGRPPKDRPKEPLDGGARLQLAIYRLALERLVPDLARGDAAYIYLGGRIAEETLSDEDFEQVRPRLAEVAEVLRSGLRAGLVFSRPEEAEGGRCSCPFPSICGAERARLFERKQADPRLGAHLDLDAAEAGASASPGAPAVPGAPEEGE